MAFHNLIWSKGIYERTSYMLGATETIAQVDHLIEEIKNCSGYLWVRSTSMPYQQYKCKTDLDLVVDHLHLLDHPVVLVTSDGDRATPSSYRIETVNTLLNSEKITYWFSQNYDQTIKHEKLKHYPIGLDLHTARWLINGSISSKLAYYQDTRDSDISYHVEKIFCDAHLTPSCSERIRMYEMLGGNSRIQFLEYPVSFKEIIKTYRTFKFVISPPGNGLDCHRTWELFLLGCIVITKTSSLDDMWKSNELPVVVLQDWDELNEEADLKLKDWYLRYNKYTTKEHILPKYSNDYWLT